jgi:hypothetical protein
MSSVVEFFIAPEGEALRALEIGPQLSWRTFRCGNFDALQAIVNWESWFTGESFASLLEGGIPSIVAEDEDGVLVWQLSDALIADLASARPENIQLLAIWWSEEKTIGRLKIEEEVALRIINAVSGLARQAEEARANVYCRTS